MFPAIRRRVGAGLIVLLACCAAALAPSPAVAADGAYTHLICANPDTGRGVATDGQLPSGTTATGTQGTNAIVAPTRCGANRVVGGSDGIPVSPGTNWTASSSQGAWLTYKVPAGITFSGATLYRYGAMGGSWVWSVTGANATWHHDTPRWEDCLWNFGCTTRGSSVAPFGAANAVAVPEHTSGGFRVFVACHSQTGCAAGGHTLRLYGAKATLRDDVPPRLIGTATGSLASDDTLAGAAEIAIAAEDGGAGIYRVVLRVDGQDKVAQLASFHGGRCVDANPANEDLYEFAHVQPCSSAIDGIYSFDTTALPEGEHQVVVQVEDAAGKRATVVNRRVVVDNYPAPVATSAPVLEGSPRRGSSLSATPAAFDDHGAPGDVVVSRTWQRCRATCSDIAGVDGLSYTLGSADVGSRIRVVERAVNSEGSAETASVQTARVTLEDGTLPVADDEVDNDCDGVVDEAGEAASCPPPPGSGVPAPDKGTSGVGAVGLPGRDGTNGADGANGITTTVANSSGAVNGDNGSARARLTARFDAAGARRKVVYGKSALVRGRLVDASGRPIRNAIVDVAETPSLKGAKAASGRPAVTNADGEFSYRASSKAGSRTLTFAYRYLRQGPVVAQSSLALTVRAGVKLSVRLRGIVASYTGRVLAGSMPKGGKLVIVQGRAKGASWQTFASRRANKHGKFKGKYRLKVRRPGKRLQFRVRVISESGWNYGATTSKAVTRRVK